MARTVDQIQADIDKVMAEAAVSDDEVRTADGSMVHSRPEGDRQRALAALRAELATVNAGTSGTPGRRTFFMFPNSGY